VLILSILSVLTTISCSGGGGDGGGGVGTLSLNLTDASTTDFKAVCITIADVQVHVKGNENSPKSWKSVDMPIRPLTVNLLELVNGVREDLGIVELEEGQYTQMRLIIGDTPGPDFHPYANYVITNTDPVEIHELKVPSGFQTGFKIVNGFEINAGNTTELILDFDACRSVVQAGKSGKWLLKPTVKVLNTSEYAFIEGRVVEIVESSDTEIHGINGALVTVQVYNEDADPVEDKVIIKAATVTDMKEVEPGIFEDGHFKILVEPLTLFDPEYTGVRYNVVVYIDSKYPECEAVTQLEEGETKFFADDIVLGDAEGETGEVDLFVVIPGDDPLNPEQYATISFRQQYYCTDMDQVIEVKAINGLNLNTEPYKVALPFGSYNVVASTLFGYDTLEETVTLDIANTSDVIEFDFTPGPVP
jgi:hypothetical protein